jgi:hypothetical protein
MLKLVKIISKEVLAQMIGSSNNDEYFIALMKVKIAEQLTHLCRMPS